MYLFEFSSNIKILVWPSTSLFHRKFINRFILIVKQILKKKKTHTHTQILVLLTSLYRCSFLAWIPCEMLEASSSLTRCFSGFFSRNPMFPVYMEYYLLDQIKKKKTLIYKTYSLWDRLSFSTIIIKTLPSLKELLNIDNYYYRKS